MDLSGSLEPRKLEMSLPISPLPVWLPLRAHSPVLPLQQLSPVSEQKERSSSQRPLVCRLVSLLALLRVSQSQPVWSALQREPSSRERVLPLSRSL